MKANPMTFQVDPETMQPRPPSLAVFFGGPKDNTVEAMEFHSDGTMWECPEGYFHKGNTFMGVATARQGIYQVRFRIYVTKDCFSLPIDPDAVAKIGFVDVLEWLESAEESLEDLEGGKHD